MAKFFSKPTKTPAKLVNAEEGAIAGPSSIKSDFEKTFKPFVLQKDKTLAPSNWFLAEKKRKRAHAKQPNAMEVIVLDGDEEVDVEMQDPQPSEQELEAMTPQGRFNVS
jgi:chromatin assembly factor 1 subunit A